jgi:hypothetical protein
MALEHLDSDPNFLKVRRTKPAIGIHIYEVSTAVT